MNERVMLLRDAVVKITQMLSGKGITVTQRGINAYVKCDHKGRPTVVNLPYLPDNATEELCMAIQGFLDHEVAHIMFSDFTLIGEAEKIGAKSMLNMLEDARIEKAMAQRFTGSGHNLSVTGKFFLDKYSTPMMQEAAAAGDANKVIAVLMVPLIRAMAGQFVFKEYMKDKMHIVQGIYDKIADLEPQIEAASSTQACLDLAKEIESRLRSGENSKGKKSSDKEGDDDGEEESEAKTSKGKSKKGEKKPKDKKGASKSEESEESEESESEAEAKPDKESDEKGEGESKKSEKKENEKEDADEGEDENESEEESSDEDEGVGEGDGGGDAGDGEGAQDTKFETGDTGAVWAEIDKENKNGFDSALSSIISNAASVAAKESSYLVYTKEGDVVEPLKVGSGYDSAMLVELSDKVDHMVGPLQKDLERAIAARSLATWEAGRRSGRLHAANLARLAVDDGRVFRRRQESTSKDVAVELVVDASGSMRGAKVHLATQAAYALSSVLERIGISNEVICFTTGQPVVDYETLRAEARKIGRSFTRVESLYMPILKSFNERLKTDVKERFGWLPNSRILRNNVDGECLEVAARRLLARREAGKVMIVLSDGAPNANGDTYTLATHLKKVVGDIAKTGINIVGIGIMTDEVRKFYPKNLVINNVSELPDRVVRELKHLLLTRG
jgi:cobalamin biosynthesis protein CobT